MEAHMDAAISSRDVPAMGPRRICLWWLLWGLLWSCVRAKTTGSEALFEHMRMYSTGHKDIAARLEEADRRLHEKVQARATEKDSIVFDPARPVGNDARFAETRVQAQRARARAMHREMAHMGVTSLAVQKAMERDKQRLGLKSYALANHQVMSGQAEMKMGPCQTCVFVLERVKQGTEPVLPAICSELYVRDPAAYAVCEQVLGGISEQGNNVRFWLMEGCYKYEIYGAKEWSKPCPSHVICSAMKGPNGEFCPTLPMSDPFAAAAAAANGGEGGGEGGGDGA